MSGFDPAAFAFVMILWLVMLCLHEFSHAWVALQGGDDSVVDKGYLTFNPLRYTHPVYSILLPLVFVGLGGIPLPGGAVFIDWRRLRSRGWRSAVSLAGPLSGVVALPLLLAPFWLGWIADSESPRMMEGAYTYFVYLVVVSIALNLLPVPPLDGFGAIAPWLRPETEAWFRSYGLFFLMLIFVGLPRFEAFWRAVDGLSLAVGIPPGLIVMGEMLCRLRAGG